MSLGKRQWWWGRVRFVGPCLLTIVIMSLWGVNNVSAQGQPDPRSSADAPQVLCVTGPHVTWNGNLVTLKGVARAEGADLAYQWDFGDQSLPATGVVSNPYAISATHTYTGAVVGEVFTATLTVTDTGTGLLVGSDTYPVFVQAQTPAVEAEAAVDDGLWHLHSTFTLSETEGVATGYWSGYTYDVAYTAMALMAFEVQGHLLSGDVVNDPYVETVQRGVNFLLTCVYTDAIAPQPAGDPDSNHNGIGLLCASGAGELLYEDAIALLALANSGDPLQVAALGPSSVRGRSYKDIVQDMVDWLAYAQNEEGDGRGGWRRHANCDSSSMTTTQWPVLALAAAEENWAVEVPAWVKAELRDNFLAYIQNPDGGFGYTETEPNANVIRTGAGLAALAFTDVPATDSRVLSATQYIADHWGAAGNLYEMYAVMVGSRLTAPQILFYGDRDWYAIYRDYLVTHQALDGHWDDAAGGYGYGPIGSAWAILTLSPHVFSGWEDQTVDLVVTKRSSTGKVLVDTPLTYTVTVMNQGPDGADEVTLVDTLPQGVAFNPASVTSSQGKCGQRGTFVAPQFTCVLGALSPGAGVTVTFMVTPTKGGILTNTVRASAAQWERAVDDNIATARVTVVGENADVAVSKSAHPQTVTQSLPLTYTLVVTNYGPDLATDVVLSDTLPLSVTLGVVTSSQGACGARGTFVAATTIFVCNVGMLPDTTALTVTIVVTPSVMGPLTNTAKVAANEHDPQPENNSVTTRSWVETAGAELYLPVVLRL